MKDIKVKSKDWCTEVRCEDLRGCEFEYKRERYTSLNGVVYVIGYGDKVKIGSSSCRNISKRIKQVIHTLDYGNEGRSEIVGVMYSPVHYDYVSTERYILKYFGEHSINNTECFSISFSSVMDKMPDVSIKELEYGDYVKLEKRSNDFVEGMSRFIGFDRFKERSNAINSLAFEAMCYKRWYYEERYKMDYIRSKYPEIADEIDGSDIDLDIEQVDAVEEMGRRQSCILLNIENSKLL